jgi:hypothetical protein
MQDVAQILDEAGGAGAPRDRAAQLRAAVDAELARSEAELELARSGYGAPVTVGVGGTIAAIAPAPPALRADPHAASERTWLLVAALVGALVEAGASDLHFGELGGRLAIVGAGGDAELATLAFEEHVATVDRLRARALQLPPFLVEHVTDLREPIGPTHPLRVAEAVARLGGHPADPASVAEHEEAVLAAASPGVVRPHDDPDPARRIARRILQRLHGMGKWGGYHTEFVHLARGFAGNDRQVAEDVGEALLAAGLLVEKPSVGQRHVFLNPRRAADIHALIERGEVPADVRLPH